MPFFLIMRTLPPNEQLAEIASHSLVPARTAPSELSGGPAVSIFQAEASILSQELSRNQLIFDTESSRCFRRK